MNPALISRLCKIKFGYIICAAVNVPVVQVQTDTAKRNASAVHTRAYLAPLPQSEKDDSVNCSDMIDSSNPITFSEKKNVR